MPRRGVQGPSTTAVDLMELILLVVHMLLAVALIGLVLIQRSEGGALGIGGGGGMSGFMTGRSAANLLTRATAVLAALFFITSLGLTWLSGQRPHTQRSIVDQPARSGPAVPGPSTSAPAPSTGGSTPGGGTSSTPPSGGAAPSTPSAPAAPSAPSVPSVPQR
jgi:preprotein translocase subunit SecG